MGSIRRKKVFAEPARLASTPSVEVLESLNSSGQIW
jgi:hypothetical protein